MLPLSSCPGCTSCLCTRQGHLHVNGSKNSSLTSPGCHQDMRESRINKALGQERMSQRRMCSSLSTGRGCIGSGQWGALKPRVLFKKKKKTVHHIPAYFFSHNLLTGKHLSGEVIPRVLGRKEPGVFLENVPLVQCKAGDHLAMDHERAGRFLAPAHIRGDLQSKRCCLISSAAVHELPTTCTSSASGLLWSEQSTGLLLFSSQGKIWACWAGSHPQLLVG